MVEEKLRRDEGKKEVGKEGEEKGHQKTSEEGRIWWIKGDNRCFFFFQAEDGIRDVRT